MNNGTYIWKIKTIGESTEYTYIGIDNSKAEYLESNFSDSGVIGMYAWNLSGTLYRWKGSSVSGLPRMKEKGDILTMTLKLDEKSSTLSLKVNDEKEVIAVNNVSRDIDLSYRLAIASAEEKASYEIIN